MIKDESPDQTSATQQFDESKTVQTKRAGADGILNLISNFLESAGNVLLIKDRRAPGRRRWRLSSCKGYKQLAWEAPWFRLLGSTCQAEFLPISSGNTFLGSTKCTTLSQK